MDTNDFDDDATREYEDGEITAVLPRSDRASLALAELDAYLGDLRAWVNARCRAAIAAGCRAGRITPRSAAVLGALVPPPELTRGYDADARLARWAEQAPHAAIAGELGLSARASAIVLLVAAPRLWGDVMQVYRILARANRRAVVDEMLLGDLLGGEDGTRVAIRRELDAGSALIRSGACMIGAGPRPDAAIVVNPVILRRLAGHRAQRAAS